jgi:hypothetical protein
VLLYAVAGGNVRVTEWLVQTFGLTKADASELGGGAFATACRTGRIEMIQWIARAFSFTAAEVLKVADRLFTYLIVIKDDGSGCYLHAAQWLVDTFCLTQQVPALGTGGCVMKLAADKRFPYPEAVRYWLAGVPIGGGPEQTAV